MIKTQLNQRRVKRTGTKGSQELYITKKTSRACFLLTSLRNYTPGFICYIHKLVLELGGEKKYHLHPQKYQNHTQKCKET